MAVLEIQEVSSGYGEGQILWGASLALQEGKLTSLVGGNGVGKSHFLRLLDQVSSTAADAPGSRPSDPVDFEGGCRLGAGVVAGLFVGGGLILGWLSWLIALPLSVPAGRLMTEALGATLLGLASGGSFAISAIMNWIAWCCAMARSSRAERPK